jgi:hypothetical protein
MWTHAAFVIILHMIILHSLAILAHVHWAILHSDIHRSFNKMVEQ